MNMFRNGSTWYVFHGYSGVSRSANKALRFENLQGEWELCHLGKVACGNILPEQSQKSSAPNNLTLWKFNKAGWKIPPLMVYLARVAVFQPASYVPGGTGNSGTYHRSNGSDQPTEFGVPQLPWASASRSDSHDDRLPSKPSILEVHICNFTYIYTYVYIYRERERVNKRRLSK